MNARWNGFSLGDYVPASHVEIVVPPTQINDVSAFNDLIPGESTLVLQSGTGELEALLEVNDRIAVGTLDLVAEDIVLKTKDVPMYGDLVLHANLAEGDLPNRRFDISATTIRLDDIVGKETSEKQEKKREAWYCDVELEKGTVTFGKPMESEGQIRLKMYDTRPVVATLKDFGTGPKWLSMLPNVKEVEGTMDVGFGKERLTVDDLVLTGEKLEVLGWLHILNKKADGRLFMKYGIMAAGIALDQGHGKVHISKPRKWFEEQQGPPKENGQPATADDS